jgi:hypothetical protein
MSKPTRIIAALIAVACFIVLGLFFGIVGEDQLRAMGTDMAKQHGYITGGK